MSDMEAKTNWAIYRGCLEWVLAPHITSELPLHQAHALRRAFGAPIMRWPTGFDQTEPSEWYYIIKDRYLGLSEFTKKTRNQCRRGLDHVQVTPLEIEPLLDHGYRVYCKAVAHYRTPLTPEPKDPFQDRLILQYNDPNFEVWGLWSKCDGHLIGYAKLMVNAQSAHIVEIKVDPDYLELYPSYALFPTLLDHYLNERGFSYISNGTRSIEHTTNIQELLFRKFNFRKANCRLHFVASPLVEVVTAMARPFHRIIRQFRRVKLIRVLHILLEMQRISRQTECPANGSHS
ncbi:MAG: hypothetical protein LWW79_06860 [Holophagaceae bacterium]|nr:hypothetical protein [Holophagaceae bacterium]